MKKLTLKKTQFSIVWNKLKTTGIVSRNWCLKRNITRLGAYMCEIKKSGVKFSANYDGKDYKYRLK